LSSFFQYSSIAQMLRSLPYPLPAELAAAGLDDVIYVCGDSHSMSSAWQVVKLDQCARPLLLVPRLVTGLKVWHMRPTCRFYPKRNWEAALRNIPTGASVIFNFGEIGQFSTSGRTLRGSLVSRMRIGADFLPSAPLCLLVRLP
jgi:hypothetical protein